MKAEIAGAGSTKHLRYLFAFAVFATILPADKLLAQDSGVNDTFSPQSNVDVQLQVVPGCSVSQPNGTDFGTLNFGTYPLLTTTIDQQVTMNFSLQCANGVNANILIDGGGSGSVSSRRMTRNGGSENITYQLYIDSGRNTIWNNSTGLAVAGNGLSVSYPVYGRVISQTPFQVYTAIPSRSRLIFSFKYFVL